MNISLELTRTIPESYNSPFENTDATRFAFYFFTTQNSSKPFSPTLNPKKQNKKYLPTASCIIHA